ncbi:MAG: DUF6465 family protein [Clostridium sp.]|uniref:DUF6465 family protein n=1 Tax=Clostridium sp. TaxID=1506 RepID=UPI003D6D6F99
MKKNSDLTFTKAAVKSTAEKVIKSTEETAEAAIKMASAVVKKTIAKKVDVAFYVQYQGKEISKQTILEKIHDEWIKSHKLSELKTLDVYLKVEDDTAYCLVNGSINIDLKLS